MTDIGIGEYVTALHALSGAKNSAFLSVRGSVSRALKRSICMEPCMLCLLPRRLPFQLLEVLSLEPGQTTTPLALSAAKNSAFLSIRGSLF